MIAAPLPGSVHPLEYAGDPAFAMLGAGVAIEPEGTHATVCAPVAGRIVSIHPHAFAIDDGAGGILVHLGINSFRNAEAFQVMAQPGDAVIPGLPIIDWDIEATRTAGLSPVVVVVAMNRKKATPTIAGTVNTGDRLFSVSK